MVFKIKWQLLLTKRILNCQKPIFKQYYKYQTIANYYEDIDQALNTEPIRFLVIFTLQNKFNFIFILGGLVSVKLFLISIVEKRHIQRLNLGSLSVRFPITSKSIRPFRLGDFLESVYGGLHLLPKQFCRQLQYISLH